MASARTSDVYHWRQLSPGAIDMVLNESGNSCMLYAVFGGIIYERADAEELARYLHTLGDAVARTKPMTPEEYDALVARLNERTEEWNPQEEL